VAFKQKCNSYKGQYDKKIGMVTNIVSSVIKMKT
jgi:hypothetical protein